MQGKNKLQMNQATMREAVQFWCDGFFKEKVSVKMVRKTSESGGPHFEIDIESAPTPPTDTGG